MALSRVLIKQGGNLRKSHCNSRDLEDRRGRHRNKIHVDRRVVLKTSIHMEFFLLVESKLKYI